VAIEKASGIVIRLSDYSETSQIATFLTDSAGKVAAIAKGAKRAGGSTGGPLDLLALSEIVFSTSRSGGLAILREARTIEQFPPLRVSLARYYAALYFAELCDIFGEGTEGSSACFDLLLGALRALSRAPDAAVANIVLHFEGGVLAASGLAPSLAACAHCGAAAADLRSARICLADGGVVCPACRGGRAIRPGSLAALRRIVESTVEGVQRLRLARDIENDVSGLLSAAVVHNAARVPRMLAYVKPRGEKAWRRWLPSDRAPGPDS
jgi:DNA repair protein RecO (recombination protein O)